MTAQYWTTTGYDIWEMKERIVYDLTNLTTDEVVTCDSIDAKFKAVIMPKIKRPQVSTAPTSKKKKVARSSSTSKKSKHKGVTLSKTPGKFRVQFWDKKKNKNIYLGTFDSELMAAATYQEHIGNKKEARRLRNEYEEGDRQQEVVHERIFPVHSEE